nr:hypothetical protein [Micromonospora sp. DSM 115978]
MRTTLKMRAVMALVLALVGAVALAATPAGAAPGSTPAPDAGGFIARVGVITFKNQISAGAATIQATPPESFCYVGVNWPAAILPDRRVTATWSLDCRSLANPNLPAPDIALVNMKVRVHQGAYSVWDPTPSIGGTECQRISNPRPSCSATPDVPLSFGVAYHTQLDVTATLTGGSVQVGAFYTAAIRLS